MAFHSVALSDDIKQAFLQVRINTEERHSLRFQWKTNEQSRPETFRFTRALFALICSPFLLGSVVDYNLETWETHEPELVAETRRSPYVDDFLSGNSTVTSARELRERATMIFKDTNFTLQKWHSNASELEENIVKAKEEETFAKQ